MKTRVTIAVLIGLAAGTPLPAQEQIAPAEKYRQAVELLAPWIEAEIAAKKIPALSLALVDDQTVVWARGFGYADPDPKKPATAETLYRVGSVSKPFTCLLLMIFVELGLIDLDVPVQRYLPELRPKNPHSKAITLRQIMSHRSGLVRESPVGSYFDHLEPPLADTVKSLNQTELIYEPETTTSYSNAALAAVGYLLERRHKQPFAELIRDKLLEPLGMASSSFDPDAELAKRRANAIMWTYTGRRFPAPTWQLGMPPAGSLHASVNDMARFIKFLHAWGHSPRGAILKKETLEAMYELQFAKPKDKAGFGLGFYGSEFEGRRRIGHGGAVYGFSSELAVLPDDKLGVMVCTSKDVTNGLVHRVANEALRCLIAVREDKPLPQIARTGPVPEELGRRMAGRFQTEDKFLDFEYRDGRLWMWSSLGGFRRELRRLGDELVTDDVFGFGQKLRLQGDQLTLDDTSYERAEIAKRKPMPEKWRGLVGDYGPDHNILYILEKDGKLHALIEWFFLYPLAETAPDEYAFPDYGLYKGDKIVFERDAGGRAVRALAANVVFERREQQRGDHGVLQQR